jgi:hypothetical protein
LAQTHLERSERHGTGTAGGSAEPQLQVPAMEGFVDCERQCSLTSVRGSHDWGQRISWQRTREHGRVLGFNSLYDQVHDAPNIEYEPRIACYRS